MYMTLCRLFGGGGLLRILLVGLVLVFGSITFAARAQSPNPSPPSFVDAAGPFNAEIPENSPIGTLVFHAQATDSTGAEITYTLLGIFNLHFTVDHEGRIFSNRIFDWEAGPVSIEGRVQAASVNGSAQHNITVTVTDADDPGRVIIAMPPEMGTAHREGNPITATLSDQDCEIFDVICPDRITLNWERSRDGGESWTALVDTSVHTATSTYTPVRDDTGFNTLLRARAQYSDRKFGQDDIAVSDPITVLAATDPTGIHVNVLGIGGSTVDEGNGLRVVMVQVETIDGRSFNNNHPVLITITDSGAANTVGYSLNRNNFTVQLFAGMTSTTSGDGIVLLGLVDDEIGTDDEVLTITAELMANTGELDDVLLTGTAQITITDNDGPVITLGVDSTEVAEDVGIVTVTATLNVAIPESFTVTVSTVDGAMIAGEDYAATAGEDYTAVDTPDAEFRRGCRGDEDLHGGGLG